MNPMGIEINKKDLSPNKNGGIKADDGKLDWTLIPWEEMVPVVRVLMHGASKYYPDNWKRIEPERYRKAILRHELSYAGGEVYDPDSGEHHLAHVICNALFLLWHDFNDEEEKSQKEIWGNLPSWTKEKPVESYDTVDEFMASLDEEEE